MADELEARVAERTAAVAVAIAELPHVEAEPANLARVIATGPTDIDLSQFGHQQRSGAMTTYEITSGSPGWRSSSPTRGPNRRRRGCRA